MSNDPSSNGGTETGTVETGTSGPPPPRSRRQEVADSPSLMAIVFAATIGVVLYAVFLFDFSHHGNWIPYAMVLVAESFIVFQATLALWTILSCGHDPRDYRFYEARRRLYGPGREAADGVAPRHRPMFLGGAEATVDVFITTYGESLDDIRRTVVAALAMEGRHTTYVLDDGRTAGVLALARELGAIYVTRAGNDYAKAGNVNHALGLTTGEFFVILDADFVVQPDFLRETLPFFADPTVAFVQTPQVYGNLNNLLSRGAGYMQTVFYRFMLPGKNRFNAAFCVGTNVVFRRSAVMEIGGIYQESKSEDVWTSLKLHERGWRSVYIATELAIGRTPETIEAYSTQQLRWATGGFEILLRSNPMGRRRTLTLDQRLQYFGTATFYLVGVAPLLLILVPPLQIYFGIGPIDAEVSGATWFFHYAGFYVMQIVVALYTIGSFRWETLMLATASFPIYTRAFLNALLRRGQSWSVTHRSGVRNSPFDFIVPQVLTFLFLLLTSVVGIWQAYADRTVALALVWNVTNTVVLGAFVVTAMREARETRALNRAARRRLGDRDRGRGWPSEEPVPVPRQREAEAPRATVHSSAALAPAEDAG
ncbi:glycosyltransferase family 2 protein [Pseudonocardia sp. RS010]|uniref:glycosyltransferase family 2 protein n=1 Tax=Pseudonocardia sp. RS010 TaxID=3385979 RepID=UPI0039A37A68